MKKHQHYRATPSSLPRLMFTLEQLVFLKKTLAPLEQLILTTTKPLPNLDFALATVTQVQAKINQMIRQGVWGEAIALDANEVLLLQTAVWIFAAGLEVLSPSPEREAAKKQCQALCLLFAPLTTKVSMQA